ncbi:SMP-30/gluconolactonase/LRE family protein [Novosphingobium sp. BL-8H]|uniref:SMP-30/gluconolactonase/LRE family protein n=1 Tax=Novosphingobium sp. BL-8H TaxID=3127640 RepID=UPI003758406E
MKIERIDAVRCALGEAPVWDPAEQALFLLDIGRSLLLRYAPSDGLLAQWVTPGPATALALSEEDTALLAIGNTVQSLNLATGECTVLATALDQPREATFNDGKTDRQGRFLIGSCATDFANPQPVGGIFRFDPPTGLARVAGDIAQSNGTCFSPDGHTLYFSDCARSTIYAYDYDVETGAAGRRRVFASTEELGGLPDGATVDDAGRLWVAIMRGGKIAAFAPDGTLERTIDLPVSLPGSVMFGGADLDELYVTTADTAYFGMPAEGGAGYLYRITGLGVRGLPEARCRL